MRDRMMLSFDNGAFHFTHRTVAIICHEGRVLAHRAVQDDFWSLPGGRVEWMEPAAEALRREMGEELGLEARVERLVWVVENMFWLAGREYHELGLYFLVSFPPEAAIYHGDGPFYGLEEGMRLIFRWFPVDRLEEEQLYPAFLRTRLRELPDGIEHVVERG